MSSYLTHHYSNHTYCCIISSLQKEKNGRLSKFANYIQQFGAGLDTVVASAESGTIFAPNNEAFDKLSQSELEILLGKDGRRIMGLHFVDQLIPAEDVRILQPQNDIKVFTCLKQEILRREKIIRYTKKAFCFK